MTGMVIVLVIVLGLAALWAINTFTDALFHNGLRRFEDRKQSSEVDRIRRQFDEQRRRSS